MQHSLSECLQGWPLAHANPSLQKLLNMMKESYIDLELGKQACTEAGMRRKPTLQACKGGLDSPWEYTHPQLRLNQTTTPKRGISYIGIYPTLDKANPEFGLKRIRTNGWISFLNHVGRSSRGEGNSNSLYRSDDLAPLAVSPRTHRRAVTLFCRE